MSSLHPIVLAIIKKEKLPLVIKYCGPHLAVVEHTETQVTHEVHTRNLTTQGLIDKLKELK